MSDVKFKPIIKWTGSKRVISSDIIYYFPKEIDTYYEPFLGGGSILRALIDSDIKVNTYRCSDNNKDLMNIWVYIKYFPDVVVSEYKKRWNELYSLKEDSDKRVQYFYEIRKRFNNSHNVHDFIFLLRTCFNGMPRYNKNGEFNTSFHFSRDGIIPSSYEKIIYDWNKCLNSNNISFECGSYEKIIKDATKDDFIYMDPPYNNSKTLYYGNFNDSNLFEEIKKINCKWILSYDGISGDKDNTYSVPKGLYKHHVYVDSGVSSFKRIVLSDRHAEVKESLYLNY